MKISVITPTTRPEGLKIVRQSLDRQTVQDFEWIVIAPHSVNIKGIEVDTLLSDPPKQEGDVWTYNKAMNKAIKQAQGDYILFFQDNIYAPNNALEKFLFWIKKLGDNFCITGVGDQYLNVDKWGKPLMKVWTDPRRKVNKNAYECYPEDWEMNFAFCTKKAIYDIGGFQEDLDQYFGMDNISVCERLDDLGYRFWIDQSLEIRGIKHDRSEKWDELHAMHGGYIELKEKHIKGGTWPKMKYLKQPQKN